MIKEFAEKYDLPKYRVDQFLKAYYQENILSWELLYTWPKDLRTKLAAEIPFSELEGEQEYVSEDGRTTKVLSFTKDGYPVETVLMGSRERRTVCVSCMSGCPVGCKFCATGQMKSNKILNSRQIVDQILYFKRKLGKEKSITNVVFMGMGEPMLNLDNVVKAIRILTDPQKIALSHRRITLSSVGYVEPLTKFLNMNLGVKIAISLHAPNQKIRESIMPTVAKTNKLEDLMSVLIKYQKRTNKRITYEYLLLKGVNDSKENARELAKLLKNQISLVNLINFNVSDGIQFVPSNVKTIKEFQEVLTTRGITNTLRYSFGTEIKAACGQLANQVSG